MILYFPEIFSKLSDYGIEVPLQDDRASRCFAYLQETVSANFFLTDKSQLPELLKKDILRVHTREYCELLLSDDSSKAILETYELIDAQGNYNRYNPEKAKKPLHVMVGDTLQHVRGTLYAMDIALTYGRSYYLGGGMHHALADKGRGFCLVNDIVIGLRRLQDMQKIKTAWVIDVDAHKGCGTAAICADDDSIQTLSMHMGNSWPLDMYAGERFDSQGKLYPWHIPSDVDIPIYKGKEDLYLTKLAQGLKDLAKKSGQFPDFVVVVDGADPHEEDILPSTKDLALNLKQLLARDEYIYNWFKERSIPQVYLMAGGYGPSAWQVYAQFISKIYQSR